MKLENTVLEHFSELKDPRLKTHRNFRYHLTDILVITVLATICGADNWVEIYKFGLAKESWLKTFLELPNGIPSPDTFAHVFARLDPVAFERCFAQWIASLSIDLKQEIIALDGKAVRGSGNKRQGHPAIPQVLEMIDVTGATVTIDAMGCQTKIARQIIRQGANYVLSLKENQPMLSQAVCAIFALAEGGEKKYKNMLHLRRVEKLHNHGRIETRRYTLISARKEAGFSVRFPGLKGIGKVDITRTTHDQVEYSTRYFVTSLNYEQSNTFVKAVRQHWQIEVDLHWSLDVSFREDLNQSRIGHSADNLALVRRIALNLLKQESTHKHGISCRRKTAGWDHQYLLKVLTADQRFK